MDSVIKEAMKPLNRIGINHLVSCFMFNSGERLLLGSCDDYLAEMKREGLDVADKALRVESYKAGDLIGESSGNALENYAACVRAKHGMKQSVAICRRASNMTMTFQVLEDSSNSVSHLSALRIKRLEKAVEEYTMILCANLAELEEYKTSPLVTKVHYREDVFSNFSEIDLTHLTAKSIEALKLMCQNFSTREIAEMMGVSVQRIKQLIMNLQDVFRLSDKDDISLYAYSCCQLLSRTYHK